jgi:hypothetical protein
MIKAESGKKAKSRARLKRIKAKGYLLFKG